MPSVQEIQMTILMGSCFIERVSGRSKKVIDFCFGVKKKDRNLKEKRKWLKKVFEDSICSHRSVINCLVFHL